MSQLRGILLDIDGTLLDSNDAHAQAWVEAFAEFGHTIPFEKVRALIGKGGDKLVPELTGLDAEKGEGKKIGDYRKQIFRDHFLPELEPFPRVRELLGRLRQDGLQLVIATSASKQELQPLLEAAGIADLVDEKTSSDDADSSKPDPDIVQAALKRAGLKADQVVLLGDTPYDIEAAARAGVRTIALRCGGWDDQALGQAIELYDDAADLLEHYDQSPLART